VDFWKVGIAQNATYEWRWSHMLSIEKIFCYICLDPYPIKMPPFWIVFAL
jgi:hypothetical protein